MRCRRAGRGANGQAIGGRSGSWRGGEGCGGTRNSDGGSDTGNSIGSAGSGGRVAANATQGQSQPAAVQAPEAQQSPSPCGWSPPDGIGIDAGGMASAIAAWWQGGTASAAARTTALAAHAGDFAPFNLLLADADFCHYMGNHPPSR